MTSASSHRAHGDVQALDRTSTLPAVRISTERSERLLFIPYENSIGDQVGPRRAFQQMKRDGVLEQYESFPLPAMTNGAEAPVHAWRSLSALAEQMQPTLILWQHPGSSEVPAGIVRAIHRLGSNPVLAFEELDGWGLLRKRLTRAMRALAREADVVFLPGTGGYERLFRWAGAKRTRYSNSAVDLTRFGSRRAPAARELDVVMIASHHRARVPYMGLPGARTRLRLAHALHAEFGNGFRVFGNGWEGAAFDGGAIRYDEQEEVNQRAWVAVAWHHFPRTPLSFSDRLPITLASAIPLVTNLQPGYEGMFPPESGLFWGSSVREIVDLVRQLTNLPKTELIALGNSARQFAITRLSQEMAMRRLIVHMQRVRLGL